MVNFVLNQVAYWYYWYKQAEYIKDSLQGIDTMQYEV